MTPVQWNNWSGSVVATPAAQVRPNNPDALRAALTAGAAPLRVRGAGHSFTPLCATSGTLIALDEWAGPLVELLPAGTNESDADGSRLVRLQAGATLNQLSAGLQSHGLAFHNLGDIDVQSLAGATATATHGTGRNFSCLSGEIRGVSLMTAAGEVRTIDGGNELSAAQVSLGTLGVVMTADVRVRPAFKLHRKARVRSYANILQQAPALWRQHRNFEFFVLPCSDYALALTHYETDAADLAENVGDDHADLQKLKLLRTALGWAPAARRWVLNRVLRGTPDAQQIGTSWELLASDRRMRFNEMEYHLPEAVALDVLDEVRSLIERERRDVFFPIECRMTAGDTAWLSPFQGAPRVSIAVHAHHADDYQWFFKHLEPIFRRAGGRPHWGKLHSLGTEALRELYPDFERFCALRREFDPRGRFLNPHTAVLFGEQPASS